MCTYDKRNAAKKGRAVEEKTGGGRWDLQWKDNGKKMKEMEMEKMTMAMAGGGGVRTVLGGRIV
jgi:hypothetical protein